MGDKMMKNMGGGRHCREAVVLMYSFGPASVIKPYFSAFSSICFLSLRFINDKHGRQLKQMSVVLANQDLLDAFCCCCSVFISLPGRRQALALAEKKNMWNFFSANGLCVDVTAM